MPRGHGIGHTGGMPELVHPSQLDPRLTDLQRPQHTGFTGGLCRAMAQRWKVDPIIVRLAFVALAFAGGAGAVLYVWGCLLTPRVGGHPPILRWLPSFGRWPLRTQGIVVAVSSLVLILSFARQSGVAWGPVIVVAAVAWAVARQRRKGPESRTAAPSPHRADVDAPVNTVDAAPGADESVEQWRTRLEAHAGSPLPTVDLYAPEPPRSAPAPAPPAAGRTSWWGALTIVSITAAGAALPWILGLQSVILWTFVAAAVTSGTLLLGWSVIARRRRLPSALLALALAGAVGTSLLAVAHSQGSTVPLDTTAGGTAHYSFVGEMPAELDLSALPVDVPATVTIDATASAVRLRVTSEPSRIIVNSETSHVELTTVGRGSTRSTPPASELDLIVEGNFNVVILEVAT